MGNNIEVEMTFTPIEPPVLAVHPLLPKQMPGAHTLLDQLPTVELPEKMRIILAKMGFGTLPEVVSFAEAWAIRHWWSAVSWERPAFEGKGIDLYNMLTKQTDPIFNQMQKKMAAAAG